MGRDEPVDLVQQLLAPRRREGQEVAARRGERAQRGRGDPVGPRHRAVLGRREEALGERGLPVAVLERVTPVDDLGEPAHPVHRAVPDVPHDAEPAAGPQHARDLRLGRGGEPVPRLGDQHGVDARVRQRDGLRRSGERLGLGDGLRETAPHRVRRLHGDDVEAARDEPLRELPGAGGEVEDAVGAVGHEPVDGRVRVGRPGGGVLRGTVLERRGPVGARTGVEGVSRAHALTVPDGGRARRPQDARVAGPLGRAQRIWSASACPVMFSAGGTSTGGSQGTGL